MSIPLLIELPNADVAFQPSHDALLVEPAEASNVTTGGLYLPNGSLSKVIHGTVIASGPGNVCPLTGAMFPLDHKVGDKVVFRAMAQLYEVKVAGKTYILGRDTDVAGRVVTVEPKPIVALE